MLGEPLPTRGEEALSGGTLQKPWPATPRRHDPTRRRRVAPQAELERTAGYWLVVVPVPVPSAGAGAGAGVSVVAPPAAGAISVVGARNAKYSTAITTITTITPTTHLVLLDIPSLHGSGALGAPDQRPRPKMVAAMSGRVHGWHAGGRGGRGIDASLGCGPCRHEGRSVAAQLEFGFP